MRSTTNLLFSLLIAAGLFVTVLTNFSYAAPDGAAITVHMTNMNPHVGQNFYLRAVDKGTLKEVYRMGMNISNPDFDVVVPITEMHSYFLDFFADVNGNDLYDMPPTDHAWRIDADDVTNGQEFTFSHNTNFVDIDWVYVLTVHFTGMTPHVGELLELRVAEDNNNDKEVDRVKVNPVPSADFDVTIVGLKLGMQYKIEFYADHNGNGLYDPPPTDHAWLIAFENTSGNVSVDFAHNTNFTDINWRYLLTVNLMGMVPHVGQLFELRVVDTNNQNEINRVTLNQILVPDFSVFVDGLEVGHNYNIDFYADFNGNGGYDPPPADHAWRLNFMDNAGDFMQEFTHNTNFTDIQWPPPTSVEDDVIASPETYALLQNYPNPFNPSTTIKFNLGQAGFVTLKIYDILGNEVNTLVKGNLEQGLHEVNFSALNLNSGVYFYRLESGSFSEVKKMTLLK